MHLPMQFEKIQNKWWIRWRTSFGAIYQQRHAMEPTSFRSQIDSAKATRIHKKDCRKIENFYLIFMSSNPSLSGDH